MDHLAKAASQEDARQRTLQGIQYGRFASRPEPDYMSNEIPGWTMYDWTKNSSLKPGPASKMSAVLGFTLMAGYLCALVMVMIMVIGSSQPS